MKILKLDFKGGTFGVTMARPKKQEILTYYVQFSFKNPWWLPKKDSNFADLNVVLYGWLFFYFGYSVSGILVPNETGEFACNGQMYSVYGIDKSISLEVHERIKQGYKFNVVDENIVMEEKNEIL